MRHTSLSDFLASGSQALARGPVAMIFCEDDVEIEATARHHLDAGFPTVLLLMPPDFPLPAALPGGVYVLRFGTRVTRLSVR